MIYGWNMLYQVLRAFSKINIQSQLFDDEMIALGIWKESLNLEFDLLITGGRKRSFYQELERLYDIKLDKDVRQSIITIGDLKQRISQYSEYVT